MVPATLYRWRRKSRALTKTELARLKNLELEEVVRGLVR
jgi:hypothetical protein